MAKKSIIESESTSESVSKEERQEEARNELVLLLLETSPWEKTKNDKDASTGEKGEKPEEIDASPGKDLRSISEQKLQEDLFGLKTVGYLFTYIFVKITKVKWLSGGMVLFALLTQSGVIGGDPGGDKFGGNNCTVGREAECPKLSSFEMEGIPYDGSVTLGIISYENPHHSSLKVDIYEAGQRFNCSTAANASLSHNCSLVFWEHNITVCKGFSLEPMGNKSIIKYSNVTQLLYFCVYVEAPNQYHISQRGFYIKDITPEIPTPTSLNQTTATTTTLTQDPKYGGKVDKSWKLLGITAIVAFLGFILIGFFMYYKGWRCFKASEYNLPAEGKKGDLDGA